MKADAYMKLIGCSVALQNAVFVGGGGGHQSGVGGLNPVTVRFVLFRCHHQHGPNIVVLCLEENIEIESNTNFD